MSSQHQTFDVSDGETGSVGIDPYVWACGIDSLGPSFGHALNTT